jgi:hypothetical protein
LVSRDPSVSNLLLFWNQMLRDIVFCMQSFSYSTWPIAVPGDQHLAASGLQKKSLFREEAVRIAAIVTAVSVT